LVGVQAERQDFGGALGASYWDYQFNRAMGATSSQAFRSSATTFAVSAISYGIGTSGLQGYQKVLAHGVVGGLAAEAQGGDFVAGFFASGVAKGFSEAGGMARVSANGFTGVMTRTAIAAMIGGTVSEMTGGKFANGARTATLQHLFNYEAERARAAQKKTFLDGAKSFFEDLDRVEQHYKALSGASGEEAKQHALDADLALMTASAAYYFDATIEIDGQVYNIRERAQAALTKSFYENTEYFAGRAFAQGSVGMATTTVMKRAFGLKLFSRQTGALYAPVWAGNAGSLLTISSFGRGLNLYDQGVRDPVSLLSGSVIGTN
jgi:hypothetical protein